MKKNRILSLLLCMCLLLGTLCPVCSAAEELLEPIFDADFTVNAKAAMLIDLNNGRVIYEQNADEVVYPASLTKIMTCLIALERGNLSDMVTVSEGALENLGEDSSLAGLQAGEQLRLEDLLYCMMIVSGNEACNVIAEHIAGNVGDFVRLMNERAYQLGCQNTHFANPHGLHNTGHYTTARDLSIITQAALKSENFRTITNTTEYELPQTNLSEPRMLETTNLLINKSTSNKYYYPRASGIKTGYTGAAGRCVISTAKGDGLYLLGIVCGAPTTVLDNGTLEFESFPECAKLFQYGFNNYKYVSILSPLYPVAQMTVTNSAASEVVALSPKEDVKLLMPINYDPAELHTENHLNGDSVEAPVHSGDVLGSVTVTYMGEFLEETDLVAIADVARSEISAAAGGTGAFVQRNWWKWVIYLILALIALFVVMIIVRRIQRQKQRRLRMQRRRQELERRFREEQSDDWR